MKSEFKNPNFDSEFEKIIKEIRHEVMPSKEEISKGHRAMKELERRIRRILKDYPKLSYKFLGSFPRNTWLKGNLEIDLFILFPEDTENQELERIGLEIGRKVLDETEERYAAHPYVHGKIKGVEADVVPCYKLDSAEKIKSAVDRTPFHHEWIKERIKGLENDVRLLKAFLKASGIYGAEYKVRGFSGYLCELLIFHYKSFKELVKRACNWRRGLIIDVAGRKEYYGSEDPLFVIDPVDCKRNVAANLSIDSLARFVEKCRDFYLRPSKTHFVGESQASKFDLEAEFERRGTKLIALIFERPRIVEDNLYTQLERAKTKLFEYLERENFLPLNSGYFVSENACILLFETQIGELSKIKKVLGPPFEEWDHAKRFKEKRRPYKAFLEGGRYHAFDAREITNPGDAIREYVRSKPKALGKNIAEVISSYEIVEDKEVLRLGFEGFSSFLADFFKLREVE
jgi:tRNA nucleotidyltransferase (CCA-adding enzyme)